jgi:hypothetical protein
MIETMVQNANGNKVVIIAHSLGTRAIHYFLRRIKDKRGREWISNNIENWIALGPLWLGAPKSIRALVTGERMGLDDFLYLEEGLELSRTCGSTCWMLPYLTHDYPFQEFSFIRNSQTNRSEPKNFPDLFRIGECGPQEHFLKEYYEVMDPLLLFTPL